jgi:hypothetical protein
VKRLDTIAPTHPLVVVRASERVHIFARESNFLSHEAIMNNHLYNKSSFFAPPAMAPVDDEKRHQQISMTKHKNIEDSPFVRFFSWERARE